MLDQHYFPLSQDEINAIRLMPVDEAKRLEAAHQAGWGGCLSSLRQAARLGATDEQQDREDLEQEATPLFDTKVKSRDAEAKTITFELADHTTRTFPLKWGGWEEGTIGILRVREEDAGADGYGFQTYPDQNLRRHQEGDQDGKWAWRIDGDIVLAKVGVIPGKWGALIEDQSWPIVLDLPPEFVDLCSTKGISVEQVLRGFIADLCGLQNYLDEPREDGYSSNGSDERHMAHDYFERAYGMY